MGYCVGLDVSHNRTSACVVEAAGAGGDGCATGVGCAEGAAGEDGPVGCAGTGGDAADGLVRGSVRQVGGEPSQQGAVVGA